MDEHDPKSNLSLSRPRDRTESVHIFSPGDVVAQRYRVIRFINSGGMGQVYEATDAELAVNVALKTLRPELIAGDSALRRFKQEIQIAREITHPNICRTFDFGRHSSGQFGDVVFLTMEFLRGITLAEYLVERGALSSEETLALVEQMAEGLTSAHKVGIVHRDFKTSNVMLLASGTTDVRVKIMDFGVAQMLRRTISDQTLTATAAVVGTPSYMAPEQTLGIATSASDIYSLGVVAYEMLAGSLPCRPDGTPEKLFPVLPDEVVERHPAWSKALCKCLNFNPSERYPSPTAFFEALRDDTCEPSPRPSQKHSRRKLIAAGVGALALCGSGAVYLRTKSLPAMQSRKWTRWQ